ncbi:MAG: adenosylcobinamide-phosphate synthase CbiB [Pseudomonadota bacterium]|nr:adenosylcobinamide-phosphate synthase CbiB [Pseudomonadota bacterium]
MFDPLPLLILSLSALAFRAAILLVAMALDWLIGEPDILWRHIPHPVVIMGRAISRFDRRWNRRVGMTGRQRRMRGGIAMSLLTLAAAGLGVMLSWGGALVAAIILAVMLAARSLDEHIRAVADALDDGVEPARRAVGMVVGRDTGDLTEAEIARAAIETGAENLSDGVIAPALWFLLAGLPGLFVYKLVNTADSMIGYRNARYLAFGCVAARLDDLLNIVPARLTALLICGAAALRGRGIATLRVMIGDGRHHASPNAGWPEAAMAGALDVWLAGPRRYGNRVRHARKFNDRGAEADAAAILRALRRLISAQILFALLVLAVASLA